MENFLSLYNKKTRKINKTRKKLKNNKLHHITRFIFQEKNCSISTNFRNIWEIY